MFTVENFIASYSQETSICLRLFNKMPPGGLDFRFSPGQRSTLELLRYLSYGPYNGVRRILADDWTLGKAEAEASKDMPASDFPRKMAARAEEVTRLLRSANPLKLETETFTFPWGDTFKKGEGLVNVPLKWLVGYRMQLFLQLKAAGAKELNTRNLWFLAQE